MTISTVLAVVNSLAHLMHIVAPMGDIIEAKGARSESQPTYLKTSILAALRRLLLGLFGGPGGQLLGGDTVHGLRGIDLFRRHDDTKRAVLFPLDAVGVSNKV